MSVEAPHENVTACEPACPITIQFPFDGRHTARSAGTGTTGCVVAISFPPACMYSIAGAFAAYCGVGSGADIAAWFG